MIHNLLWIAVMGKLLSAEHETAPLTRATLSVSIPTHAPGVCRSRVRCACARRVWEIGHQCESLSKLYKHHWVDKKADVSSWYSLKIKIKFNAAKNGTISLTLFQFLIGIAPPPQFRFGRWNWKTAAAPFLWNPKIIPVFFHPWLQRMKTCLFVSHCNESDQFEVFYLNCSPVYISLHNIWEQASQNEFPNSPCGMHCWG